MTVRRYPIGALGGVPAELRVAVVRDLVLVAVHRADRCSSGPLAIPADAVETLRSALGDLLGENGTSEATEPDRLATREPRSQEGTP